VIHESGWILRGNDKFLIVLDGALSFKAAQSN
jgi:hypothetical protein